jgi:outer membrane receptor protein involved in Fe transport
LRILLATSSVAIAAALAYPAVAQEAPAAAPPAAQPADQGTPPVVDQTDAGNDANQIVVIANALRGAVDAPQPPVIELNEQDIASYGASSLADLVSQLSTELGSGRGRGGGRPVFLVNGLRVSSFREMQSFPPEAIRQVQVLPEEVAQRYGFPPDQRVINFILKDNFSSKSAELKYGQPYDGGTANEGIEGTYLNIAGKNRLNFDLKVNHTTPLTEAERDIVQTVVPTFASDPDPAAFRTLVSKNSDYQLTGNYTKGIGDAGASLSLNGTAERSDSLSYSGLNQVFLTGPGADPDTALRTFGTDFPLARRTRTDTLSFGSTLNAHAGDWQLTGTVDANFADNTSKIDRRVDAADLQGLVDAAAVGTVPLDTPITGVGYPGYDTSESKTSSASSKFTAIGHPIHLPGGDISVTIDAGFDWDRIDSTDTRNVGVETKLTRGNLNGGVNVSVPIASTREDVLAFLGDVTANFSAGLDHLSDFGTLTNWSAGLNWGPTEKLNFQASYIVRDAAPGLSQLGAPVVPNYNVPVYDFTTGQTVLATVVTGGNPDLKRETQRDLKLGVSYQLPFFDRSNVSVEYFRNRSNDVTASFPVLTPDIEAAFPSRVQRDAFGNLVSIDERPVTFYRENASRLRIGINISGRIGKQQQQGGGNGGGRGGRGGGGDTFVVAGPGPGGPGGPPPGGAGGPPPGGGGFFFGGGGNGPGGAGGARGNFNPQAFAEFRQQLCSANGGEPDLSKLPEQMRTRLAGPDGKPDPARLKELHDRVCNGNGGGAFNPQAFQQLRQTLCPADKALDPATLPAQIADRFKGADGQLDQARLAQFRTRVCSIDPAPLAAQRGQQAQGGGAAPAAEGGQAPQQAQGGGGRGGGGGFRGFGGRGGNGGRWNLSLSHTIELGNKVLVAPGGPLLDLLHGDALSGGGVARHTFSAEGGVFYNGIGMRASASYKSGTHVQGTGAPGSSDLNFGDLFTLDLRLFADLGRQEKLVKSVPFFENSRVSFGVNNLFDARQKVTDQNGVVPLRYQPYLIDPNGRSFSVSFRKLF